MSLPMLQERARTAQGCLDWLDVCGAECCKTVILTIPDLNPRMLYPGRHLTVSTAGMSPDMLRWNEYHGTTIGEGSMTYVLKNFQRNGNNVKFKQRCSQLTEDNRCKLHGLPEQPAICRDFNLKNIMENNFDDAHVTNKCLFKFKKEDRYGTTD